MRRYALSRPVRLSLLHEVLLAGRTFFDYGCGRGDDISQLIQQGISADGWDPYHRPTAKLSPADVVNLGYVVNVIEDPLERLDVLKAAWTLAKSVLVVSARLEDERDAAHVAPMHDGWVTRRGTFQKFFAHDELGAWIESSIGERPVAAGLGVYYAFRDATERETYLASRFRRRISLPRRQANADLYELNREILQPLIEFVTFRGRLPDVSELPETADLARTFGSLRQALRVALIGCGESVWDQVRRERTVDLLVHLALAQFHGRPRWSELPAVLQRDVKAFFPSYSKACEQADKLLFAAGNQDAVRLTARASSVGKVTPNGIYVHISALNDLPALLRVYEGCARALVGTVEEATVVKLHRDAAKVSYLSYPDFDAVPHPRLIQSVVCDLAEQQVRVQHYQSRQNPPVLHRKELFVAANYPLRAKFARLTAQEERAGLFALSEQIGTVDGWADACRKAGVVVRGHRLLKVESARPSSLEVP